MNLKALRPLVVLLVVVFFLPFSALAQSAPQDQCIPLDIVILLGQSSSMLTVDPNGLRVEAVRTLIDMLYDQAAYRCPGVLYRIGVLGFGDDAHVLIGFDMPEGQIRVGANEPQHTWAAQREASSALVVPEALHNSSYRAALEAANTMLATPAGDGSDQNRRRVITLLLDGTPCTRAAFTLQLPVLGGVSACSSPQWIEQYLLGNVTLLNRYTGANYPAGGFDFEYGLDNFLIASEALSGNTSFNVIFFTTRGRIGSFGSQIDGIWSELTASHNGTYFSPAQIGGDLRQIAISLDQIVAPYLTPARVLVLFRPDGTDRCTGTFVLEPYLSSATLVTALNNADGTPAELLDPHGESVTPTLETRINRQYTLNNPLPGAWSVHTTGNCETADATYEALPVHVVVLPAVIEDTTVVSELPYYKQGSSATINLFMMNAFGGLIVTNPDYPLDICGTFTTTSPAADSALKALGCFGMKNYFNVLWRADTPLPAPVRGSYLLIIEGTVSSADPANSGTPIQVFEIEKTYTAIDSP